MTDFMITPPMATYLIGFVISDFEFATNELTKEPLDTLHRVSVSTQQHALLQSVQRMLFTSQIRSNANKTTTHALELSEKLLKLVETYLDFDYELPKLDSAAIPGKDGREN